MFHVKSRKAITLLSIGLFVGGSSLFSGGMLLAEEVQDKVIHNMNMGMVHQESPGWAETVKRADHYGGRPGRPSGTGRDGRASA